MLTNRIFRVTIISCLMLVACFRKSDTTGAADDVTDFLLYSAPEGNFMITHEEIFHAQSKSYNNGISQITGYAKFRYIVRELLTGIIATAFVTGDRNSDLVLLGYDGKNLWFYNSAKDGGIEARNPVNMQVTISRKQIEATNPAFAGQLSIPKSYEANQFYAFDYLNKKLILTDLRGVFYEVDPVTFIAKSIENRPEKISEISEAASSSVTISSDRYISMEGDLRKIIVLNDSVRSSESFLKAEFVIQTDPVFLAAKANRIQQNTKDSIKSKRDLLESMKVKYPFLQNESSGFNKYEYRDVTRRYNTLKRDVEDLKRDSANGNSSELRFLSNYAMGIDSNNLYIIHANNLTDTSSLIISKLKIESKGIAVVWNVLIPGIYFDPDRGIQKNPMKEVFKSGSPSFNYERYSEKGNVFCGVKMLFAFGIDAETGRLLWKKLL